MKVLITGGSGYLGQATIRALQRHGHQAVALARSDDADGVVTDLGATVVRGGLSDLEVLHKTAIDVDAAIHLAQDYGPETAGVDLRAATAIQDGLGSRPYVHTGGVWVYGNTGGVVDETAPQAPPPVTAWRGDNERRILERAGSGGHPVLVMPGVVYGHGGGLIGQFIGAPGRAGAAHYIGAGDNRWAASTPALTTASHRPCAKSPRRRASPPGNPVPPARSRWSRRDTNSARSPTRSLSTSASPPRTPTGSSAGHQPSATFWPSWPPTANRWP